MKLTKPLIRLFNWLARLLTLLDLLTGVLNLVNKARREGPTQTQICHRIEGGPAEPVVWVWASNDPTGPIARLAAVADERNQLRARVAELEKGEPW